MRVHTFIHQYQYRYTNTGYDHASIMFGDLYALATSKVSTCGPGHASDGGFLPGDILLKTIDFERPGGREWLPSGTHSKKNIIFLEWFSDPRVQISNRPLLRSVFLQRRKRVFKSSCRVRGLGPPQGPAFACTAPTLNNTKKQKLKKTHKFC